MIAETVNPISCSIRPIEAQTVPFPTELRTPPVTKMYLTNPYHTPSDIGAVSLKPFFSQQVSRSRSIQQIACADVLLIERPVSLTCGQGIRQEEPIPLVPKHALYHETKAKRMKKGDLSMCEAVPTRSLGWRWLDMLPRRRGM